MHRQWKQAQVAWEECGDTFWLCRNEVQKAKVWVQPQIKYEQRSRFQFMV